MAYDGYMEYNNKELANLSRSAQLAEVMGISTLWTESSSVQWIEDELGGTDYDDVTQAPWYDAGYPASAEFAGLIPISIPNLDDSTAMSTPIEYNGDGGHPGVVRNTTLPLVWDVAIIATTDRGADYGKRWMDRQLKATESKMFCSGADLRYFRYAGAGAPFDHRRDVRLTRGSSVTRKRRDSCSVMWRATFTMTCHDPYQYSEPTPAITTLGPAGTSGPKVLSSDSIVLTYIPCAGFDYTPIFDPLYPALVPGPGVPDFYPDGWDIVYGMTFERFWAITSPMEPSSLNVIPTFVLTTPTDARMVKISIWPGDAPVDSQCDPLFSAVVSYAPAAMDFIIDSEEKTAYVWDGISPSVRRADSLLYSPDANPVQWTAFNDPNGLLVTLDLFGDSSDGLALDAEVSLILTSKSD